MAMNMFPPTNTYQAAVSPRDFGAAGDGRTDDTDALQAAVDVAAERRLAVRLAGGAFLCGTLRLRDRTTLVIDPGACLRGTPSLERYAHYEQRPDRWEKQGDRWHRALLLAQDVDDVTICGGGTIDGGDVFDERGEERMRGPHLLLLGGCRRVRVEGVTLARAANYAVLAEHCHDVEVRGVRFRGGWDGFHARGTTAEPASRLTITQCDFQTGDDCIALRDVDQVVISHNLLNTSCNALRCIGPATRLTVANNLFHGPGRFPHRKHGRTNMLAGVFLQAGTWDRTRGRVDEVLIVDNVMRDLRCAVALVTTLGNAVGRVDVHRLTATGAYGPAMSFRGLPQEATGRVTLRDVLVRYTADAVRGPLPKAAPLGEASHGGKRLDDLDAWGLVAEHLAELSAERVELSIEGDDPRPQRRVSDVAAIRG